MLRLRSIWCAQSGPWGLEVDLFRSWRLIDLKDFHTIQSVHWHRLPYWVFVPPGLALVGPIVLIWFHPNLSPSRPIWGNLGCQLASPTPTAIWWGPWRAKLSQYVPGPDSAGIRLKILGVCTCCC